MKSYRESDNFCNFLRRAKDYNTYFRLTKKLFLNTFTLYFRLQVLEEKLETVQKKTSERKEMGNLSLEENKLDDADSSYGSDDEFDEYIDWRSKRAFK